MTSNIIEYKDIDACIRGIHPLLAYDNILINVPLNKKGLKREMFLLLSCDVICRSLLRRPQVSVDLNCEAKEQLPYMHNLRRFIKKVDVKEIHSIVNKIPEDIEAESKKLSLAYGCINNVPVFFHILKDLIEEVK